MLEHFYGIGCDGPDCPKSIGGGYSTSKGARHAATKAGWTRVKGGKWTGRDYCPGCAEARSRAAARLVERNTNG